MKRFKKVYIEITNACNLSCKFCPSQSGSEYMPPEKFRHVIESIRGYTDYVYLHVLGEPLLHGGLNEVLEICREHNMYVNITTNGILIKEKGHIIKNRIRLINFSLHSITQNNILYWEKYITDIFDFVKEGNGNTYYCFRLWDSNTMHDETHKKVITALEAEYGIKINSTETKGNGIMLKQNIFLQIEKQFSWPQIGLDEIFCRGVCYGLKDHAAILVDGTVVPCCLDYRGDIALGNIFNESFLDVISGSRAKILEEGFANRIPIEPLCKTCGFGKSLNK